MSDSGAAVVRRVADGIWNPPTGFPTSGSTIESISDGERYWTIAVVCNQWGDTGKGKFVDLFAQDASIIARGTGGANAGHTVRWGDQEAIYHLLPSGMKNKNATNILG